MKNLYVKSMRVAKRSADSVGFLHFLERQNSRKALWLRSLFGIYDSVDLVKLDVPWWTFSAIDYVEDFLRNKKGQARVYEYGAGASTVWLAKRCVRVVSVEHDRPFAALMSKIFSEYENVNLNIVEPTQISDSSFARSNRKGYLKNAFDEYVKSINDADGLFDLIVIDGRARVSCLKQSIDRLAPGGIILFDNSDRDEYRSEIESCGLVEIKMKGLAPALPLPSQTSLLIAGV